MTLDVENLKSRYAAAAALAGELESREDRLDALSRRVDKLRDEVATARRAAEIEAEEAAEWSSGGFHHLFTRLTGRLEERTEKEAREAVAAAAAHAALEVELEECIADREAARDAVRASREARSSLAGLKGSLKSLVANDEHVAAELERISAERAALNRETADLTVLLRACSSAKDDLSKALDLVTTTKRLAALDAASDGFSRWKIHELRDTVAFASRLQRTLVTLQSELEGETTQVRFAHGLRNENGSYMRDIWLDGFLIDGLAYQGISELKTNLEQLVDPLENLQRSLLERSASLQASLDELSRREHEVITGN